MSISRLRPTRLSRRNLLQASAAAALLPAARFLPAEEAAEAPLRAVTRGPRFHWFAYYDKLQFDAENRRVLGMEVDFEHRSPRPEDRVRLGMADLQDGDRWIELGESTAWCWQQGCMLQWRPGHDRQVLWNDRAGDRYVCRIHDLATGQTRTVAAPIYAVAPDGRWAVNADFRRINDLRPGYGYAGLPDPYADERAPKDSGIEHVDLETGAATRIVSIADAAAIPFDHGDFGDGKHWFNHLLVNPDGTEMLYLLSFYLPRFQDRPLLDKLATVVHELWHIGPAFDGDLRRHEGRCYAHGPREAEYHRQMEHLARRWLETKPPDDCYEFLRHDFQGLRRLHGTVEPSFIRIFASPASSGSISTISATFTM